MNTEKYLGPVYGSSLPRPWWGGLADLLCNVLVVLAGLLAALGQVLNVVN